MIDIDEAIEAIWTLRQRGVHHPAEWRGRLSPAEAYAVQFGVLARHLAAGETHAGWKVGVTSKAMQLQQGVHEPVFGFLLESGARPSGTVFDFAALIRPGFENELCITVGRTLHGPGVTPAEARAAIAAVAPALEIVERRGDFGGDLNLAIADNIQQKAFVTGAATAPLPPDLDLARTTLDVLVNGRHAESATGDAVLGDPAASVAWLANKLAEFGRRLEAGMRVMSGSFTRQHVVSRGDHAESRFRPFGAVSAAFR